MSMSKVAVPNKNFWTTELTTSLILLYENYSCLYSIKSKEYHNKIARTRAMTEIAENLSEMYPTHHITVDMVQKKIHGIRTQFMNELRKMKKSESSGVSPDDMYEPKLWCFEMLHFLKDSCACIMQGESNLTIPSETVRTDGNKENDIIFEVRGTDEPVENLTIPGSSKNITTKSTSKRKREDDQFYELLSSATDTLRSIKPIEKKESEGAPHIRAFTEYLKTEMENIRNVGLLDQFKQDVITRLFRCKELDSMDQVYDY